MPRKHGPFLLIFLTHLHAYKCHLLICGSTSCPFLDANESFFLFFVFIWANHYLKISWTSHYKLGGWGSCCWLSLWKIWGISQTSWDMNIEGRDDTLDHMAPACILESLAVWSDCIISLELFWLRYSLLSFPFVSHFAKYARDFLKPFPLQLPITTRPSEATSLTIPSELG